MSFLSPIRNYVDALVPVAAQQDALTAARYRAFILPRLMGSLAALASLPVYLVLRGVPNEIEIVVFSWLITPILIVYFLVRTGRYETAHILSSLSLSALVVLVAFFAGGIGSFAAIWLVVVPLEAALSGSRRVVLISAAFSMAAGLLLLVLGMAGLIRSEQRGYARSSCRTRDRFCVAICDGSRRLVLCRSFAQAPSCSAQRKIAISF